ncbi:uncharacterized protein DDB_G0287625-like [Sitodiplosis mosellana]|uniref:uncharacterized protein DDB_G0287625-like n=1 Tax=Sitodiplosis mosellana TaxID=263140 RepID=UPI002443FD47|nr:uncharacterized protein DDB_G0287625-like [Sitodiplosis mosellana]
MSITPEVKKKIVLSILNVFAKTGAFLKQINVEYQKETGEKLAPTKNDAEEYMKTLEDVTLESDRYYSNSEKSKHIKKFVEEQRVIHSPNYKGQKMVPNFNNSRQNHIDTQFNKSFPKRQPVSYGSDYVDVNIPSGSGIPSRSGIQAGKIKSRRKTCGALANHNVRHFSPPREDRRNRCTTPDRDRDRTMKSNRSRSRSPLRQLQRRSPIRYTERIRSWSRSPPRSRAISPRRAIPSRYSPPRRRGSRSPGRDKRSKSPRNKRSASPTDGHPTAKRASRSRFSRSPVEASEANSRSNVPSDAEKTDKYTKPVETRPLPIQTNDTQPEAKAKKFKFTIIGDGYMYYMLSDMQSDVKFNLSMCNHTLTFADALRMVEVQQQTLQKKKRKVMIAIGVTDLRNGRTLYEMKRDFTALFLRCDQFGLKPLITTILCFDTLELKAKADYFNRFLMECFENVIDMRCVLRSGLADVMTALNEKNKMEENRNSLGFGTRQQLILNVPRK